MNAHAKMKQTKAACQPRWHASREAAPRRQASGRSGGADFSARKSRL